MKLTLSILSAILIIYISGTNGNYCKGSIGGKPYDISALRLAGDDYVSNWTFTAADGSKHVLILFIL